MTTPPDSASVLQQFERFGLGNFPVKILGIRGHDLNAGAPGVNDMGIFDDLFCRCIGDMVTSFRGSTDPGRHYILNPINPDGCARLQIGLWWYQLGTHRGRPALVQAAPVTVDRLDRKGNKVGEGRGYFGINHHSAGSEEEVGRYSAGCQVTHCPEGPWGATWQKYFEPTATAVRLHGQKRIPYLLVDAKS